jgi:molybdate transport system substrate-binding protein
VSQLATADTLTIAVASNFRATAETIGARFTTATGHEVRFSSASTGKLYAQIVHGAPFDILLSADSEHPALLYDAGLAVGTGSTYAIGELVLWSGDPDYAAGDCREALVNLGERKLAIANPKTAPYGRAAKEFLTGADLWEQVAPQLVYGENIAQALHFAVTGNAAFALIAKSQAIDTRLPATGCSWPVPPDLYHPIEQQAVLLQRAAQDPVALSFLQFLQSADSRDTIRQSGYGVP